MKYGFHVWRKDITQANHIIVLSCATSMSVWRLHQTSDWNILVSVVGVCPAYNVLGEVALARRDSPE